MSSYEIESKDDLSMSLEHIINAVDDYCDKRQ